MEQGIKGNRLGERRTMIYCFPPPGCKFCEDKGGGCFAVGEVCSTKKRT